MASQFAAAPGGILNVARAAGEVFPPSDQQTLVAIAGAETGWQNEAGDPLTIYGDGGEAERPFSCEGLSSFGPWQINLPANHALVATLSSVPASDPCGQKEWLMRDLRNSARAALAILRAQGYGAWTTYRTGAYRAHMAAAQEALAEVRTRQASPEPSAPRRAAALMPTLQENDEGTAVRVLQVLLNRAGVATLAVDGVFGLETVAAVLAAKRHAGLPENAVVGGGLWLWLSGGK